MITVPLPLIWNNGSSAVKNSFARMLRGKPLRMRDCFGLGLVEVCGWSVEYKVQLLNYFNN